jgi:hypothetical protein
MAELAIQHFLAGCFRQIPFLIVDESVTHPKRQGANSRSGFREFGDKGIADTRGDAQVPHQLPKEILSRGLRRAFHDGAQRGEFGSVRGEWGDAWILRGNFRHFGFSKNVLPFQLGRMAVEDAKLAAHHNYPRHPTTIGGEADATVLAV